jgi:4-amino-4-deoxy-L-arabinose transferase-like glycosyltransferase
MWSYRFFGLGLFQTRLPSLAFGAILLLCTYFAGRQLYNPLSGLLALLLLGLSWPFLEGSHLGRPDIIVAACVMAAFCFALWGMRTNRLLPNLVAGVLIALSVAVHQNGVVFVLSLGTVYLAYFGLRFWRRREPWAFVAGCVLGALYPGGLMAFSSKVLAYVVPGVAGGAQLTGGAFISHPPPVASQSLLVLLVSLVREFIRYRVLDHPLVFALIVASLVLLAIRRSESDRLLLSFLGSAFGLFVLLIYSKESFYAILLYPFLMIALSDAFVSLLRDPKGRHPQRIVASGVLVLLLISSVVHYVRPILSNLEYDYYAVTDPIEAVIPQGARIMGRPIWWLGLSDYDYRSIYNLSYYNLYDDLGLTEGLETMRPDMIIVCDWIRQYVLADEGYFPQGGGLYKFYRLPRQEFEDFVAQRGEKLLEFTDPWHGLLEVYAIHWE